MKIVCLHQAGMRGRSRWCPPTCLPELSGLRPLQLLASLRCPGLGAKAVELVHNTDCLRLQTPHHRLIVIVSIVVNMIAAKDGFQFDKTASEMHIIEICNFSSCYVRFKIRHATFKQMNYKSEI